jgi:hypothetical protein
MMPRPTLNIYLFEGPILCCMKMKVLSEFYSSTAQTFSARVAHNFFSTLYLSILSNKMLGLILHRNENFRVKAE